MHTNRITRGFVIFTHYHAREILSVIPEGENRMTVFVDKVQRKKNLICKKNEVIWSRRELYTQEINNLQYLRVVMCEHKSCCLVLQYGAGIAQSVQRLATGWTVQGSNPGGGRDFPRPSRPGPGAHSASCTMGTGSFPGAERPGRGVDHPPPSKRRGHERVELYLYSPSGPSWSVIGRTLPLPHPPDSCLLHRTMSVLKLFFQNF